MWHTSKQLQNTYNHSFLSHGSLAIENEIWEEYTKLLELFPWKHYCEQTSRTIQHISFHNNIVLHSIKKNNVNKRSSALLSYLTTTGHQHFYPIWQPKVINTFILSNNQRSSALLSYLTTKGYQHFYPIWQPKAISTFILSDNERSSALLSNLTTKGHQHFYPI